MEEVLIRGLIFLPLARRRRWLAYPVSALAFALMHATGFQDVSSIRSPLLLVLDYLPMSIALAVSYEWGKSICFPIVLHMFTNGLSAWITYFG